MLHVTETLVINPCWERQQDWLVAAIPNTKYALKYYPACNIYIMSRHNRLQKTDVNATGSGGGEVKYQN